MGSEMCIRDRLIVACANLPSLHGSPEIICANPKNNPTKTMIVITRLCSIICRFLCGCQSALKKNLIDDLCAKIKNNGIPISMALNPSSSVIGEMVIARNNVKSFEYVGGSVAIPKLS